MEYDSYNGDCLEIMKDIPDKSIDMILCDLPYGTTQNKWDSIIPLDKLWEQYKRIIRDGGIIALFSQTPFTQILGNSNLEMLKYEWVWNKKRTTGFLNSKKMPMKQHENILIFYETYSDIYDTTNMFNELKQYMISEKEKAGLNNKQMKQLLNNNMGAHYFTTKSQFTIPNEENYIKLQSTGYFNRPYEEIKSIYIKELNKSKKNINTYNPQMKQGKPYISQNKAGSSNYGKFNTEHKIINNGERFPKDILGFAPETGLHPTQKPVALLEYLIKTYTNEKETVLDNCMGSGSTGVACINTNRNFIGIELDKNYFQIAKERIENAFLHK